MSYKRLTTEEINSDILISSAQLFRKKYSQMDETWIQICLDRLTDVEFTGIKKGLEKFKVHEKEGYDSKKFRFSYRVVSLAGGLVDPTFRHCTCFFGKGFYRQTARMCTHIGAVILYRIYFNNLR